MDWTAGLQSWWIRGHYIYQPKQCTAHEEFAVLILPNQGVNLSNRWKPRIFCPSHHNDLAKKWGPSSSYFPFKHYAIFHWTVPKSELFGHFGRDSPYQTTNFWGDEPAFWSTFINCKKIVMRDLDSPKLGKRSHPSTTVGVPSSKWHIDDATQIAGPWGIHRKNPPATGSTGFRMIRMIWGDTWNWKLDVMCFLPSQ